MFILIVIIHILVSLIIIALVLLQAGKGADIGSAFGGSGSQAVFGSMSTPTVLGKLTTAVAVVFMMTSFSLAILAHRRATTIMPATAPAAAPAAARSVAGWRPRRPRPRRRAGRAGGPRSVLTARAGPGHEIGCRRAGASVALALAGVAALLTGCGPDLASPVEESSVGVGAPAHGDTFIEATIGDIAGLIPNITSDGASHEVGDLIYDGLVKADKDLNFVGAMAESWEFSPDCLELTWKLRRDIKWHDGHPFTAEDVLFTYQAMINPKTPTAYKEDFLAVKSAEVIDPYTFRVRYRVPYAKAVQSWSMWMLPKHLLERYVADGKLKESPENSRPVGTGPYRFQEWKSGEKVVLVSNNEYYQGRPYLGRVVYRVIPNQGTIFLELKAKGVDLASLTAIQYARQTEYPAFRKAFRKYRYPSSAYTYFGFNLKDPRFADRRVRQAFAHAIDKQELHGRCPHGPRAGGDGTDQAGVLGVHQRGDQRYDYSPEKAKALLAEAGWKDNGDGVLRDKDGKAFSFTIRTNQGNEERKKVAEILQQRLGAIGVKTEIQVIEWASFIKEFIKKKRFEAVVLGWGIGNDPDQYSVWHSSQMGPDHLNQISYANPEVDHLLEKGRASCLQQERIKLLPPNPGDPRRGPAARLPLLPGCAPGGVLARSGHSSRPVRDLLQLHSVVCAEAGSSGIPPARCSSSRSADCCSPSLCSSASPSSRSS